MSSQRVFTLEEASALLPKLAAIVCEQIERRTMIESSIADLATESVSQSFSPEALEEQVDDAPDVVSLKRRLRASLTQYQSGWNEIEDLGVVVKDVRAGLLDFYSRIDGKLVFLCWRYGEVAITHYHDVEGGYASRKPIEGALKARLYN